MTRNSGRKLYPLFGGSACLLIGLGAFIAAVSGLLDGIVLDPKALQPDGTGGYYSLATSPLVYWLTVCAWLCCAVLLALYGVLLLKSRR